MTKKSGQSEIQLEASAELARGALRVRAGFRTNQAEVLAGGIVEIEFFLEHIKGKALYLAAGGSRSRLRPAFFEIQATLEGQKVELGDPAEEVPELGGPATSIRIEPNTRYQQVLLVNEFVRLERLDAALVHDGTGILHMTCRRPLPLATTPERSFKIDRRSPIVEAKLSVKVQRDDAALKLLIGRLADQVSIDRGVSSSGEREASIAKLVALRSPMAISDLQKLSDHPDPVVRMYVERGLAFLNQNKGL